MTSYESNLLVGLARDLHTLGVGVWGATSAYTPGERGIVLHTLPDTPDEVVAVAQYAEAEVGTYRRDVESVITFVQIRFRVHVANDGVDAQSAVRDRYHRQRVLLAGDDLTVAVTGRQQSRGALGQDQNDRHLFTQNFSFTGLRART